jgi:hypothetical protein
MNIFLHESQLFITRQLDKQIIRIGKKFKKYARINLFSRIFFNINKTVIVHKVIISK